MTEDISELIDSTIEKKLSEKKDQKDYSIELDSIKKEINSIRESHNHSEETMKNDKHEHKTHSWDKTCVDCGENNPDYEENQYKCVDCEEPMGTKEEASKSKACPHCSSEEGAYNEKEGYTL